MAWLVSLKPHLRQLMAAAWIKGWKYIYRVNLPNGQRAQHRADWLWAIWACRKKAAQWGRKGHPCQPAWTLEQSHLHKEEEPVASSQDSLSVPPSGTSWCLRTAGKWGELRPWTWGSCRIHSLVTLRGSRRPAPSTGLHSLKPATHVKSQTRCSAINSAPHPIQGHFHGVFKRFKREIGRTCLQRNAEVMLASPVCC